MTRNEYTTTAYLQPAAVTGDIAASTNSGSSLQGSVTSIVSGIRDGDITLDVPNVEAWLNKFDELAKIVAAQRLQLHQDAAFVTGDLSFGDFILSDQIRTKMSDRIGNADGGLGHAIDEVAVALRDIHQALRSSLVTHTESDEANADVLTRIAQGEGSPRG